MTITWSYGSGFLLFTFVVPVWLSLAAIALILGLATWLSVRRAADRPEVAAA